MILQFIVGSVGLLVFCVLFMLLSVGFYHLKEKAKPSRFAVSVFCAIIVAKVIYDLGGIILGWFN